MSFVNRPYADQAQRVLRERASTRPTNTNLAYDGKAKEFFEFCDSVYPDDLHPRTITEPKLFIFLYYHAFRAHKEHKKKRARNGELLLEQSEKFDRADFDAVIAAYRSDLLGEGNTRGPTTSFSQAMANRRTDSRRNKLVGFSVMKQYLSSILRQYQLQVDNASNNLSREQLVSTRVSELMKMVQTRKAAVKKANYEEKISAELSPYLMLDHLGELERHLFDKNSHSKVNGMAGLRNRFTLLSTFQGIIRGESIFKCELSDLCDFKYHARQEPHPYHVLVMQIMTGKTNKDKTLYGRFLRHKDVYKCSIGALALYLMLRFDLTKELAQIDFTDNQKWFDIKLLVDRLAETESSNTAVTDNAYAKEIKNACSRLGIDSTHFIHFG